MNFVNVVLDLLPLYRAWRLEKLVQHAQQEEDLESTILCWNNYSIELRDEEKSDRFVQRTIKQDLTRKIQRIIKKGEPIYDFADYKNLPLEEVVPLEKMGEEVLLPAVTEWIIKTENYVSGNTSWNTKSGSEQKNELQNYISLISQISPLVRQVPPVQAQLQTVSGQYLSLLLQTLHQVMEEDEQYEKSLVYYEQNRADRMLQNALNYSSFLEKALAFHQALENNLPFSDESTAALKGMEPRVKNYLQEQSKRVAEGVKFLIASAQNCSTFVVKEKKDYHGRITPAKESLGRQLTRIREVCTFYQYQEPPELQELDTLILKK